jgi:hypothetical protein
MNSPLCREWTSRIVSRLVTEWLHLAVVRTTTKHKKRHSMARNPYDVSSQANNYICKFIRQQLIFFTVSMDVFAQLRAATRTWQDKRAAHVDVIEDGISSAMIGAKKGGSDCSMHSRSFAGDLRMRPVEAMKPFINSGTS